MDSIRLTQNKIAISPEQNKKEISLNNKSISQNLNFKLMRRIAVKNDIIKIKEISKNRILVLYDYSFDIYNIKTGQKISNTGEKLKEEYPRYYDNIYDDFIELKSKNLILWSNGKIFYYKRMGNNYTLSQIINEVTQQNNRQKCCQIGMVDIYDLYNVIELENNNLLSCNSIGLKIYNYIENEYKLIKIIPMFLDVENVIQIRENYFLVIHHYTYHSGTCHPKTYHKFGLSLFDFKSNKTNKIFNYETEPDYFGTSDYNFNYFLLKDTFIYQICNFSYESDEHYDYTKRVNNKKEDILSLNCYFNSFNITTQKNILNIQTSFRLISHYKEDLVFAQDYKYLHICHFLDNIFTSVYKFNFNKSKIISLENNDIIVFGSKKIWHEIKENGVVKSHSCYNSIKYFNYYKSI